MNVTTRIQIDDVTPSAVSNTGRSIDHSPKNHQILNFSTSAANANQDLAGFGDDCFAKFEKLSKNKSEKGKIKFDKATNKAKDFLDQSIS